MSGHRFNAGFAHRLILKDGAVPVIKDPGHDSELQMVSETASNVSLSFTHAALPPGARLFSERIVKLYIFFYKYDQTKDFLEIGMTL